MNKYIPIWLNREFKCKYGGGKFQFNSSSFSLSIKWKYTTWNAKEYIVYIQHGKWCLSLHKKKLFFDSTHSFIWNGQGREHANCQLSAKQKSGCLFLAKWFTTSTLVDSMRDGLSTNDIVYWCHLKWFVGWLVGWQFGNWFISFNLNWTLLSWINK